MQQIYKTVVNRFFIIKIKQLKTKNIKNCLYFININIKSFALNINRVVLRKNINKNIVFIQYLVTIYILETKYIYLYIKD